MTTIHAGYNGLTRLTKDNLDRILFGAAIVVALAVAAKISHVVILSQI